MPLHPEKLETLRGGLRGPLLLAGDPGYDEARAVWNGMIDRRPPLIVRATGNADVIAAVNFARENGLPVSVKGGGHSVAGKAVSDDALLIDLSLMNGVHVDPKNRRARAGGGATWGIFDRECQVYGLASTGGVVSTTGVGGLTLGGGLGWLMSKHGLSVDNLLSADVVTADGKVVTASESENADLFWALRGGSGNFGVVTSFEFRLHPVGPVVTGGLAAWPIEKSRDVLTLYKQFTAQASEDMTAFAGMAGAPDGSKTFLSMIIAVHTGSLEDGAAAVKPLKEFGPPMLDLLGPIPYTAQQSMFDAGFAPGAQVYWTATFLSDLTPEAIEVLVRKGEQLPTLASNLILEHFHGAVTRVPAGDTAFSQRGTAYQVIIAAVWHDEADADRSIAWARATFAELQPFSTGGVYVNYLGVGDDESRIPDAYGINYERLAGVKQQYDPDNLFRTNQNIKPVGR